jgi:hypothetical protein
MYAASASGSLHRKLTNLFGGDLTKFAPTETPGIRHGLFHIQIKISSAPTIYWVYRYHTTGLQIS